MHREMHSGHLTPHEVYDCLLIESFRTAVGIGVIN